VIPTTFFQIKDVISEAKQNTATSPEKRLPSSYKSAKGLIDFFTISSRDLGFNSNIQRTFGPQLNCTK
jgi:hypothetical protein